MAEGDRELKLPNLPPLPEPEMEDVPYEVWGQNAVHKALYTANQMHQRDRQIVELCAQVCAAVCHPSGSDFGHGFNAASLECERNIRALLGKQTARASRRLALAATAHPQAQTVNEELVEALKKAKTCSLPTEVRDVVNAAIARAKEQKA